MLRNRVMRGTALAFILACVLAVLPACDANTATPACNVCAEAILLSQSNMPPMTHITSADEGFGAWLETSYDIDPATVTDGSVYYVDGTTAEEIAVLRCASASDARSNAKALEKYVQKRRDVFSGYAPDAEHMLSESLVMTHGDYVALMVCPSPSSAELAFENSFTASPAASAEQSAETSASAAATPEPTETPTAAPVSAGGDGDAEETPYVITDAYDHDAVLAAWESGNPTDLSAQNRDVYDAAVAIIQEVTNDSMLPYEKERAVHDRLIQIIEYDPLALARDSAEAAPPESSTPYGALVHGQAICYGYSSSFQLLMDMLGIECITVDGTINEDNDPHSWNMVNLDGSWYLVDVGWDDPLNEDSTYMFFNRKEEEYGDYNRKWNKDAYPRATGGVWEGENAV